MNRNELFVLIQRKDNIINILNILCRVFLLFNLSFLGVWFSFVILSLLTTGILEGLISFIDGMTTFLEETIPDIQNFIESIFELFINLLPLFVVLGLIGLFLKESSNR